MRSILDELDTNQNGLVELDEYLQVNMTMEAYFFRENQCVPSIFSLCRPSSPERFRTPDSHKSPTRKLPSNEAAAASKYCTFCVVSVSTSRLSYTSRN